MRGLLAGSGRRNAAMKALRREVPGGLMSEGSVRALQLPPFGSWAGVWASVGDSVWASVWGAVWAGVRPEALVPLLAAAAPRAL